MSITESVNVVLIGHICIDRNTAEHAAYTSWGSSVLYMARYLQENHHLQPIVISSYGPDLIPFLPQVSLLPVRPNKKATLLNENDTRTIPRIRRSYHVEDATEPEATDDVKNALRSADLVVFATLLPNYTAQYIQTLMGYLQPGVLKVLSAQGYFHKVRDDGQMVRREFVEANDIVPQFDMVIYSHEDHAHALRLAKKLSRSAPSTNIIVTEGPEGATIVKASESVHIPTKPVPPEDIVDSVGCGDVFAITTAYHYRLSGSLEQAVKEAHRAAAKKLLSTPDATKPQT